MIDSSRLPDKFWRASDAIANDSATEEDTALLNEILAGNPLAQQAFLDYCQLHIDLSIDLCANRAYESFLADLDAMTQSCPSNGCAGLRGSLSAAAMLGDQGISGTAQPSTIIHQRQSPREKDFRSYYWLAPLVATILGGIASYWMVQISLNPQERRPSVADQIAQEQHLVHSRLVRATRCLWEEGTIRPALGQQLRPGESLSLLEGIAEFSLISPPFEVSMQLEGPVAVVLTAEGMPILRYGKITLQVNGFTGETYDVETAFGRAILTSGAEVGISSHGSTAEVHAFQGAAVIESPWFESNRESFGAIMVHSGESIRIGNIAGEAAHVERQAANRERFATKVMMNSDYLAVGPGYIQEIYHAKPVAYWRFEGAPNNIVRNEMQDRFDGRVRRTVEWIGPLGNQAIQFGMKDTSGSVMVSEDSWDEVLATDYSIEAWVKPSHYHHGSIVGFVGEFDPVQRMNPHGLSLEVCGTASPRPWWKPKQIRFLHRPELTTSKRDGVNCFAEDPYMVRRWQHVVASRQGSDIRLYVDGKLTQSVVESTPTPRGLQLVLGQLYTDNTEKRYFVGQIDEVAIYDRALSEDEIRRHYHILRPSQTRNENLHERI